MYNVFRNAIRLHNVATYQNGSQENTEGCFFNILILIKIKAHRNVLHICYIHNTEYAI